MVFLRNISVDTLRKEDTEDNNNNYTIIPYFALQYSLGYAKEFYSKFIKNLGARPQKRLPVLS
jgi:hypothetical protein